MEALLNTPQPEPPGLLAPDASKAVVHHSITDLPRYAHWSTQVRSSTFCSNPHLVAVVTARTILAARPEKTHLAHSLNVKHVIKWMKSTEPALRVNRTSYDSPSELATTRPTQIYSSSGRHLLRTQAGGFGPFLSITSVNIIPLASPNWPDTPSRQRTLQVSCHLSQIAAINFCDETAVLAVVGTPNDGSTSGPFDEAHRVYLFDY